LKVDYELELGRLLDGQIVAWHPFSTIPVVCEPPI
jgi:hypothetical protein